MASFEDDDLTIHDDDDIIEMRVGRSNRRSENSRDVMENFLRPRGVHSSSRPTRHSPATSASIRQSRRHERRAELRHHQRHVAQSHQNRLMQLHLPRPQNQPAEAPAVIDLTEEPDSPVEPRAPSLPQSQTGGRNPRRTNSQRSTPPRLARSDSTFMSMAAASYIDLTADSPEDERPPEPPRTRNGHGGVPHHPSHFFTGPDEIISLEFVRNGPRIGLSRTTLGGRLAGLFGTMRNIAGGQWNPPELDVSRSPFGVQRQPSPKPSMEPVPATRDGFTRETCAEPDEAGVETVVICPACHQELAYDPSGPAVQTPSGKGKRKKAPPEHHFWALKKCGHVYCADCFENRKPTKTNPEGVGFPGPNGVLPCASPNDVRCVVEDCETKVALKSEWVGIYL